MTNSFGQYFKITTFGESHGEGVGVVIDGCPASIEITEEEIYEFLKKRRPGTSLFVSPRKELDIPKILSGVYQGKTTGAPICIWIANEDAQSQDYDKIHEIIRPSHSSFTYLKKYGHYDPRGGGRASARETAARAAAAAIARKVCEPFEIQVCSYLKQIGNISIENIELSFEDLQKATEKSPIFCPDAITENRMATFLNQLVDQGDSIGGVVEIIATGVPAGIGDPQFLKIEAQLAQAMLSIPGTKGFEVGSGFHAAKLKGSEHNDIIEGVAPYKTTNNFAGGVLAGITTGEDIILRVAFKPTSSIKKQQDSFDIQGNKTTLEIAKKARHDPCIAIRGVQVVKSMLYLTLADRLIAFQKSENKSFSLSNWNRKTY